MDGETVRTTIQGAFTFAGVIIAAWIASRTTIITSQIALKQIETKAASDAAEKVRAESAADKVRDETIEELRAEINALHKEQQAEDSEESAEESAEKGGYGWMNRYRQGQGRVQNRQNKRRP